MLHNMRRAPLALMTVLVAALAGDAFAVEPGRCLDLRSPDAIATVSGVLRMELFAGPPNYESIARGDAEEAVLILELPAPLCADDSEFIGPTTTFDRMQVSATDPALLNVLIAAIGRRISVRGKAFGAHTAHHRCPTGAFRGRGERPVGSTAGGSM